MKSKFKEKNKVSENAYETEALIQKKIDETIQELTRVLKEVLDEIEKYRIELVVYSWKEPIDEKTKIYQVSSKDAGEANNIVDELEKARKIIDKSYISIGGSHVTYGIKIDDKDVLNEMDEVLMELFGHGGSKFIFCIGGGVGVQWCRSVRKEKYIEYECGTTYIPLIATELRRKIGTKHLFEKLRNILIKVGEKVRETEIGANKLLRKKLDYASLLAKRLVILARLMKKEKVEIVEGWESRSASQGIKKKLDTKHVSGILIRNKDLSDVLSRIEKFFIDREELPAKPSRLDIEYVVVTNKNVIAQRHMNISKPSYSVVEYKPISVLKRIKSLKEEVEYVPSYDALIKTVVNILNEYVK